MLLLLGVVLIFIGFVLAVARRGLLPGTSSEGDPLAGHSATTDTRTRAAMSYFTPSGIAPDAQSRRRKLVEVLIGLGLMVLGVLCIVFGR
jgi:hypothetical protein